MLEGYPCLSRIIADLDDHLVTSHPSFFGENPTHPFSPLKPYKVIHDHLWGTSRFTWRELVLIDSPLLQRLRGIHQTGLAYLVYPSARHSRFEHSLGVLTVASRVFDALQQRAPKELREIAANISGTPDPDKASTLIGQWRQELRLAALLHDTGHSLHSHASEQIYSDIDLLKQAADELSTFVGKEKGAGEVLSFCLARTAAVSSLLAMAEKKVMAPESAEDLVGSVSMSNVSLLIVGRSYHPLLQFLGDIVSSGFDADKLDYLLRDASAAGLPLRYDLERYLYTVFLDPEPLTDGESELEKLYSSVGSAPSRCAPQGDVAFPYYDAYRLRLPKTAMSTIEQIIICKLMLFSYIYHHAKVRSAEGLLVCLLRIQTIEWRKTGYTDEQLLRKFLSIEDSVLDTSEFAGSANPIIAEYAYRIKNRLLPRQVFRLSAAATTKRDGAILKDFFIQVEDKANRRDRIRSLDLEIGWQLLAITPDLAPSPEMALLVAGVWVDVPKVPSFEDTSVIVGKSRAATPPKIQDVFPIGQWTEAYEAHRFFIRIFAFSEHLESAGVAAKAALKKVLRIENEAFYEEAGKERTPEY